MSDRSGAGVVDLAERLIGEARRLLAQHIELLKAELRQEAARAAQSLGLLLGGVLASGLGLLFLALALGILVGDRIGSRAGGLAIVGGALAVAGGVAGALGARALGQLRPMPESAGELREDMAWLRRG